MNYSEIRKIYFIWNADFSLKGLLLEIRNYIRGIHVCSLCNIAYSGVRQKPEWKSFVKELAHLGIKSKTLYRNRVNDNLRKTAGGSFPVVIVEDKNMNLLVLLNSEKIDQCMGDINIFKSRLFQALGIVPN